MSTQAAAPTTTTSDKAHAIAGRLLRGSVVYAVANFGLKTLNFALLPVYTRFLTPADYGTVGLAEAVAAVFAIVFTLSLEISLRRFYFEYRGDPRKLARYLSSIFGFAAVWGLGVVALTLLAGPTLLHLVMPRFSVSFYPYIALAVGTAATSSILQYRLALYQVEERPTSYAWLALVSFLCTAAATLILVVAMHWGALGMLAGKFAAAVLSAVLALVLLWRWLGGGWDWAHVRESLPVSLPLVPHSLMALGLVLADRFVLQRYRSLDEVGIYTLAYTLGMAMYLVTMSTGQAWQPIFFDVAQQGESARGVLARMATGLFVLWALVAAFGSVIAQDFMRVMDVHYRAAGMVIPWVIAGYLMHGLFALLHLAAVQAKRTHFILFASAAACVINIGLNLLWVPRYGMFGAAWATVIAYALEALFMYGYAQRVFPVAYRPLKLLGICGAFAIALGATQLAGPGATLRPLLMLAGFAASAAALWWLGGQELLDDVRRLRARRAS